MSRLPLVFALLALGACSDEPKKTAPTATATATATPKAETPKPPPPPVPAAPATLTSLPPGAMAYGRLDMTLFRTAFDLTTQGDKEKALASFEKLTGTKVEDADAAAEALGLDLSRPVLFAAVGPKAAPLEALASEMAKAKTEKERDAVYAKVDALDPLPVVLGRFILPLGKSGSAKLLAALGDAGNSKVGSCPKAKACAQLPGAKQVLEGRGEVGAVYLGEDALIIDGVTGYREETRAAALASLAAFHARSGGPAKDTCSLLATATGTAVCIVGPPAEDAGVATGLSMLMRAVNGAVEMETLAKVIEVGTKEALQVRVIAAQKPTILDDGTVSVSGSASSVTTLGSWRVTEDGKKALSAYTKKTCAKGSADAQTALTKLGDAMGVKGGDEKALNRQIREAGWAGLVVALEGAWPAYVPAMNEALKNLPPDVEICIELAGDRLQLTTTFDAAKLIER